MRVLTTVTSAAATTALVTLAAVKEELALTSVDPARDTVLTRYIGAASTAMQRYRGGIFAEQSYRNEITLECVDRRRAEGASVAPLLLSVVPVISVASVTEDGVALGSSAWSASAESGFLFRKNSAGELVDWSADKIVVAYSAGYATLPDDVIDACVRAVKWKFFARLRDPAVRSRDVSGVYSASYWGGTGMGGTGDFPQEVADVLDRYRIPAVA
jgi:hypothetical protein